MIEKIRQSHLDCFGSEPLMLKAPSRINLIGEHTDYNLGYSLPAAVGQSMIFGFSRNDKGFMNIEAYNLDERIRFSVWEHDYPQGSWTGYFKTIITELKERDFEVDGINCTFGGDIPIGAGMSSSSALNCGFLYGLNELFGWKLTNRDIMFIAQAAEHRYGVKGGLMDQYTILNGQADHALLLDFKTLTHTMVPLVTGDYHFVLFNTCVKHSLVHSPYNQRRHSCDRVLTLLHEDNVFIQSYQDFDEQTLDLYRNQIKKDDFIKAQFVLRENDRVLKAAETLESGDLKTFGQLLWQSHEGLRNDYEVSCEELDFLVDHIREKQGVLGSRMMGGGFGGCTINLIHKNHIKEIWDDLDQAYHQQFGIRAEMFEVEVGDGIRLLDV